MYYFGRIDHNAMDMQISRFCSKPPPTTKAEISIESFLKDQSWIAMWQFKKPLGAGFKYLLFSPIFGEDSHFDEHIFQMGWWKTTN